MPVKRCLLFVLLVFTIACNMPSNSKFPPSSGNSQGSSFSPDDKWVAFTAYFDKHEVNGCEVYTMRVDGTDQRRLTNNDYCDYQPRWGP